MIPLSNLEEQLETELSKANVNFIVHNLGNNEEYYHQLWDIIKKDEYKKSFVAAWVWDNITMKFEYLFQPYIIDTILHLSKVKFQGTKRLLLRMLCRYKIPYSVQGKLYDFCSKCLMNAEEPAAIKVHSMQLLYNISNYEPELKLELHDMIEFQYDLNSVGFKSRANKLLKKLRKELT